MVPERGSEPAACVARRAGSALSRWSGSRYSCVFGSIAVVVEAAADGDGPLAPRLWWCALVEDVLTKIAACHQLDPIGRLVLAVHPRIGRSEQTGGAQVRASGGLPGCAPAAPLSAAG